MADVSAWLVLVRDLLGRLPTTAVEEALPALPDEVLALLVMATAGSGHSGVGAMNPQLADKAFDILWDRHKTDLWKAAYAELGDSGRASIAHDVHDVLIATACNLLSALQREMYDPARLFEKYLNTIVHNAARDVLRSAKRFVRSTREDHSIPEGFEPRDGALSSLDRLIKQEDHDDVMQIIRTLRAQYRDVLLMRYYDDLSFPEIGVKLGLSANHVHRLHERAKKAFERRWTRHLLDTSKKR